jgi:hypothetical protein
VLKGAVSCLTVQQLYYQNILSLSTFVYARDNGVSPVMLNPHVEVQASISRATTLSSVLHPSYSLGCCLVQELTLVGSRGITQRAWLGLSFGQRVKQWEEAVLIMQNLYLSGGRRGYYELNRISKL